MKGYKTVSTIGWQMNNTRKKIVKKQIQNPHERPETWNQFLEKVENIIQHPERIKIELGGLFRKFNRMLTKEDIK